MLSGRRWTLFGVFWLGVVASWLQIRSSFDLVSSAPRTTAELVASEALPALPTFASVLRQVPRSDSSKDMRPHFDFDLSTMRVCACCEDSSKLVDGLEVRYSYAAEDPPDSLHDL